MSELVAAVYTSVGFDSNGNITTRPNTMLTQRLLTVVEAALVDINEDQYQQGVLTLNLRFNVPSRVHILWYYQPMPNVVVPLRLLNKHDQLNNAPQLIAGMINERPL